MGLVRMVEIKGTELMNEYLMIPQHKKQISYWVSELMKGRGIKERNEREKNRKIKCVCLFVMMIAFMLIY